MRESANTARSSVRCTGSRHRCSPDWRPRGAASQNGRPSEARPEGGDERKGPGSDRRPHAREVSCRQPQDEVWQEYEAAASRYFKAAAKRPTIAETVAYYRERRIGLVMF